MRLLDLSIIIVNYNTKRRLKSLMKSINNSKLGEYGAEVIVVDNASKYNIKNQIREFADKKLNISLIQNKQNLGYAKANNKGIRRAKGRYVLLLNSDTLVERNTFRTMIEFMDQNQNFAAAGCRIELPDRRVDPACHRGFPTPWASFTYFAGLESFFPQSRLFGQYHQTWKNLNIVHDVDAISGAFFMIRKEVLAKVGLLDERFFVYAEDIDLCLRLKDKGYKIAYFPNTKIIHYKMSSGRNIIKGKNVTQHDLLARKIAKKNFFETMKVFYDKHYKDKYPWIVRKLVLLGIWLASKIKD